MMRTLQIIFLSLAIASGASTSAAQRDADPPDAAAILASAFANRYEVDLTSEIELVMSDRAGREHRRVFEAISKVIDGRMHSIGRLEWPNHLRGMTIMTIEADGRGHDAFVYLPSLGRTRRVSTAQRADSFFGTDVTYEDLERRYVEEYDVTAFRGDRHAGEDVHVIHVRPVADLSYSRAIYIISAADTAILQIRYFKADQPDPYRVISSHRRGMIKGEGHIVPTRMTVENHFRGTRTEVEMKNLRVNPEIDDRIFSLSALERDRDLPLDSR